MNSAYTVKDVHDATISRLIQDSHGHADVFPYEDVLSHARLSVVAGCSELGIPITARFGGFMEEPVPEEISSQLRGREYQIGMTVEYGGQSSVVVFLSILPGEEFPVELFDPDYDSVERFKIEPGRQIPLYCRIQMLRLASADRIGSGDGDEVANPASNAQDL